MDFNIFICYLLAKTSSIPKQIVYSLALSIGFIIGLIQLFISYASSKSKVKIFSEAKKMFNGKINMNGETELMIKDRKVILNYELENIGVRASEYIIANIDITGIEVEKVHKCDNKLETLKKNNRTYAVIYCAWGYKGEKFRKRIENKIELINNCV